MTEKNSSTTQAIHQKASYTHSRYVIRPAVRPPVVEVTSQANVSKGAMVGRLPIAFIRKGPAGIKRKTTSQVGFRSLPFVAGPRTDSDSPCWHVPATGGYFGGYETGEAMAQALLKLHRSEKSADSSFALTHIVKSFMRRFEEEGGKAMDDRRASDRSDSFDSLRGQYVGFFNTMSEWLEAVAQQLGGRLDKISNDELLSRANAGLNFDEKAYMDSLEDDEAVA